jgi:beta-phosphoglucomutase-like phosphatase (HAD superfamily)
MKGIEKLVLYQSVAATAAFTINGIRPLLARDYRDSIFEKEERTWTTSRINLAAKDDDVNDLFSAYMAQRKDKPLGSSEIHSASNTDNIEKEQEDEPDELKKRWAPGQRLKRILSTGSSYSEPNFVQPIPLGQPNNEQDTPNRTTKISSTQPPNPPSLLQKEDIESINESLETFTNDMQIKLDGLSIENPGSIPPNAKEILHEIVERKRDVEIREKSQQRALESFDEYQERMRLQFQNLKVTSDSAIDDNPVVKEIVEEAAKNHEFSEKRQEEMKKFQEYEASLKSDLEERNKNAALYSTAAQTPYSPPPMQGESSISASFEEQQLKILEDLLERRNQASENGGFDEEDIYLTDNIEDGIDELRQQIASSSSSKGSFAQPDSLKEWQMYRSIATKLANKRKGGDVDTGNDVDFKLSDQLSEDSDEIQTKLQAWKEFKMKEEEMRAKSGLTIKYRPPFEWSDKPDVDEENLKQRKRGPIDREQAEKAKTEFDDLALGVLTNLMHKTQDAARKEKLRNEIEELKEGIRNRQEDLKNRGPEVTYVKKVLPITIGDILRSPKAKAQNRGKSIMVNEPTAAVDTNESQINDSDYEGYTYSDSNYEETVEDATQPPPDSDFYRELEEDSISLLDEKEQDDDDSIDYDIPSLGTFEEQKFRSLVARSGVRSVEGQNELQQQWEEFQAAEKLMREKAGLSVGGENLGVASAAPPKVDYDVNAIFKDDGDIDFDKILTSIGTRPSRKNKKETGSDEPTLPVATIVDTPQVQEHQESNREYIAENSQTQNTPVANIVDTPQVQEHQESNREYIAENSQTQNTDLDGANMRSEKETVEEIDNKTNEDVEKIQFPERGSLTFGVDSSQPPGFDQRKSDLLEYKTLSVSQVDSLIGLKSSMYSSNVSPYLAKMNKPFKEYGAIFSLEGVLVDATGFQYDIWMKTAEIYDLAIPTLEDVRIASVHKEEFAIQRIFYWTDDIFTARKIAETYREVRKDSFEKWRETADTQVENEEPESTTALGFDTTNPATIEDGAEKDVESDITQIQLVAWERAAKSYGYRAPSRDLLNIVGTMKPDEAIRAVFHWTNDFLVSSDVGNAYRKYLKEETSKWVSKGGIAPSVQRPLMELKHPNSHEENKKTFSPSLDDVLILKQKAWANALDNGELQLIPPTLEEIKVVDFAGIERAPSIFKWDTTPEQSSILMSGYRKELKSLTQEWMSNVEDPTILTELPSQNEDSVIDLEPFVLKSGVNQWLSALEDVYVPCSIISHMEKELVGKILDQMQLSRFFPEENRISLSTGYGSEMQQMLGGALRLERRPDHCIVFSATPQSAAACHEVDMKNVAIVSPYPYYELTRSDIAVRDFGSIGVINLKNIFSETPVEEPMEQVEVEGPQIRRQTMLKTRFWDDGDR